MSRLAKILHQISNEPFNNGLLVLGLTIATVIIWFIVDFFTVLWQMNHEPMGLDIRHCYNIQLKEVPESAPDYDRRSPSSARTTARNIAAIANRLQQLKSVEAVGVSRYSSPYTYSNSYSWLAFKGLNTDSLTVITRPVSPSYLEVFRYADTEQNGSTRQLVDALKRNELLISGTLADYFHQTPSAIKGKKIQYNQESMTTGGVFQTVKYEEYNELKKSYQVVTLLPDTAYTVMCELSVRVRPADERAFITHMQQTDYRESNIYISHVTSYEEMRHTYLDNYNGTLNRYRTGFVFILINVFLGLYGTFSYRTWQRRKETGLMKVLGATGSCVALRLFAEALLLQTVATGLAVIIALNLTHLKVNMPYDGRYLDGARFIITMLITYAAMAVTILLSILHPVVKTMKIKPIDVLKHD